MSAYAMTFPCCSTEPNPVSLASLYSEKGDDISGLFRRGSDVRSFLMVSNDS